MAFGGWMGGWCFVLFSVVLCFLFGFVRKAYSIEKGENGPRMYGRQDAYCYNICDDVDGQSASVVTGPVFFLAPGEVGSSTRFDRFFFFRRVRWPRPLVGPFVSSLYCLVVSYLFLHI